MIGKTALSLYQERFKARQYIPFGCTSLDETFSGIPTQGITELSGEAGSGKTQICLSLAIQSVLNQSSRSVEYFAAILSCGEGLFPIKRLSQLCQYYEINHGISSRDILSHIEIEQCNNVDQATDTLYKLLPEMCNDKPIKLVIIDSLAGLLRFEYNMQDEQEMKERTQYLFAIGTQLKWLSETYNTAIVVVNQVTADFRFELTDQSIPALGLAWSHCVNTRFIVSKPKREYSRLDSFEDDETTNQNQENKENELSLISTVQKRKMSEVFFNTTVADRGSLELNAKIQRRLLSLDFSPSQPSKRIGFEIRLHGLTS